MMPTSSLSLSLSKCLPAGSGKTFTMTAIEDLAARDIFASKATEVADADETQNPEDFLSLQFYELRGNRCYDLLVPGPTNPWLSGAICVKLSLMRKTCGPFFLCIWQTEIGVLCRKSGVVLASQNTLDSDEL